MDGNDAIVSYQFFTTPNDIKFGILFKSSLEGNNGNVCGIVDVCGVCNGFLNISEFVMLKGRCRKSPESSQSNHWIYFIP